MMKIILISALIAVLSSEGYCHQPVDNSTTPANCTSSDDQIQKLENQVELLSASNDALNSRLDAINSRLDQQTETLNRLSTSNISNVDCGVIRSCYENYQSDSSSCANRQKYPNSCAAATASTRKDGIYTIQLDSFDQNPFSVACDATTQGGGWTVIQRRLDGSVDFYRNWADYKTGFGNLAGEFFIGLDKLHAITTTTPQELLITMTDFDNVSKYAKYDAFAIGDESQGYALNVLGAYSGSANDSLTYHVSQKFTTLDVENDKYKSNCAVLYKGGWWYKDCHRSNLNGLYLNGTYGTDQYAQGVVWSQWHGQYYSLKNVNMLIRPKSN